MKTLEDVRKEYELDGNLCVRNPGRFEGEHYSTVLAWDLIMDGLQDDTFFWADGSTTEVFELDEELRELWNIFGEEKYFLIEQSDNGFVWGRAVNEKEYEALCEENEAKEETQEENF